MPSILESLSVSLSGVSVFVGSLIAVVATAGAIASRNGRDPRRSLVAFLGLFLAASTRDLLWIYVGFEAFSLTTIIRYPKLRGVPRPARAMVGSGASLLGVLLVAVSSRATDLAALEPTTAVNVGVLLFVAGLIIKWLQSRAAPFLFLGASVALVAVFVRVAAWAPGIAHELETVTWLVAAAAIVAGGVGSALSSASVTHGRSLVVWLTISMVGLAVIALSGGAPALPPVLMHLAASTVLLALVLIGTPPAGTWLAMLSLASVPPFPGFVTKLALLAGLPPGTMTVALVGLLFSGIGCARELGRSKLFSLRDRDNDASTREGSWVTLAALATVIVFGLFPEALFGAATRAASGP